MCIQKASPWDREAAYNGGYPDQSYVQNAMTSAIEIAYPTSRLTAYFAMHWLLKPTFARSLFKDLRQVLQLFAPNQKCSVYRHEYTCKLWKESNIKYSCVAVHCIDHFAPTWISHRRQVTHTRTPCKVTHLLLFSYFQLNRTRYQYFKWYVKTSTCMQTFTTIQQQNCIHHETSHSRSVNITIIIFLNSYLFIH